MSLKDAPEHIQLAVDLIELLETNNIEPLTAKKALEIVLRDYEGKLELPDVEIDEPKV